MSDTVIDKVLFVKCDIPTEMPEKLAEEYKGYKVPGAIQEYVYDQGYNVDVRKEFVAVSTRVDDGYLSGIWFNVEGGSLDDKLQTILEDVGITVHNETRSAIMIWYNGADNYIVDMDTWDDVVDGESFP